MRKHSFHKIFYLCLLLVSVTGYAQEAPETWMPDAALRAAVREELGLPEATPLTKEKMQELVSLDANRRNIVDIMGLEFATNLIELHIGQNSITDLRPLANLTQLMELHFWHFPPNPTNLDLRPLANLINLEVISLEGNGISDVTPLAGLKRLRFLHLTSNHIEDVTPLAGLTNLKGLWIQHNWAGDLSPLFSLNLIDFHYDKVCDFIPLADSVESRIKNRNFPSIVGMWPEGEESTKYDFHYGPSFGLFWGPTRTEPFGLRTELAGDIEQAKAIHQQLLQRNRNILFFREVRIHNHLPPNNTAFPVDSDFWLRDSEGRIVQNSNGEYMMNLLNPDLQDLLIERIVGFSECGIFDGILLDGFGGDASFGDWFAYELIIEARIRILREVRERVRDDFLIIVNASRKKPVQYAEYVNGSAMEPGEDYKGTAGGTYKLLQVLDETLLWNEGNLRQPTVNWGEGFLLPDQPPDSPDNQRRARLFTARGLTHSDGYVRLTYAAGSWRKWMDTHNFWYSFWDADLGKPVGAKGQLYNNREGLFIREFTNGWAVYNRSGQARKIQLPEKVSAVASGVKNRRWHTIPDLDGEIYLRMTAPPADVNGADTVDPTHLADSVVEVNPYDVNKDGSVDIMDVKLVALAFSQTGDAIEDLNTDVNGDNTVDMTDLLLVIDNVEVNANAPSDVDIFSQLSQETLEALDSASLRSALATVRLRNNGSLKYKQAIVFLESLLAAVRPDETRLLANYPNPFNPETWIPYHLANASNVEITIYDPRGVVIRRLELGHQHEGYYTRRSRAAYWDGRNNVGERVASGIYFYQLQADGLSYLRKMVIVK